MKFAAVALTLAGLAAAQVQLPGCAQECVNKYTTGGAIAGCSQVDVKCICSNSGFLDGIACCLAGACPKADQETAVKYAKDICTGAGVTVPDEVVCKNATATATATNTPNAAPTMGPVALLGGLVAALAAL